ncbi:MAG TPA: sensor histidine kinase [Urbifossiella sp.]|jgi:signal transduction histidine kinase|nr:sensor histidine kinase [Urbifossiella sp.]
MPDTPTSLPAPTTDRLLAYVADLELEVDRLRRQSRFIERQATETLAHILRLCTGPADDPPLAEIEAGARGLAEVIRDLHDPPGYHPAHDQVVAIAVRPIAEQVFRWQQRLTGARRVELRLELEQDHVEWFPARLRHILGNLMVDALRHRAPADEPGWVAVGLRATADGYELRVSDNGPGPPAGGERRVLDLFHRPPARVSALGAGLAVVRLLVEQSGGTLRLVPRAGRGTDLFVTLPRYDLLDYLD